MKSSSHTDGVRLGRVTLTRPDPLEVTRPVKPPTNIGSSRDCRALNTYRAEHEVAANPDTPGKDCAEICMH